MFRPFNAEPPWTPRRRPVVRWPVAIVLGGILLEIFGVAWVGSEVGALWTVLLVVLTSVLGVALVRLEGLRHWARMQAVLARGETPGAEVLEVGLLVLAGVLLLVPGFFSDVVGLSLLLPPLRRGLAQRWYERLDARTRYARPARPRDGHVLEGEWRDASGDGSPTATSRDELRAERPDRPVTKVADAASSARGVADRR